jgi:hypothetical protein
MLSLAWLDRMSSMLGCRVIVAFKEIKRLIDLQDEHQACLYKVLNWLLGYLGVRQERPSGPGP